MFCKKEKDIYLVSTAKVLFATCKHYNYFKLKIKF